MSWFLDKINGWKTIVGYILLQIPWFAENPMLIEAIEKWIADMSNPQAIGELVLNILLAIGVIHKIAKPKS